MKTFVATFAAILAAAAVIFGVYSVRQRQARERATWHAAGQTAIRTVQQMLENLRVGEATKEEVERFRDVVKRARETLAHREFPKESAPAITREIDDVVAEFRRRLTVHRDTEALAKILEGI